MKYRNLALACPVDFHQFVRSKAFEAHLTTSSLMKRLVTPEAVERIVQERQAELAATQGADDGITQPGA